MQIIRKSEKKWQMVFTDGTIRTISDEQCNELNTYIEKKAMRLLG